ncbi:MAG: arginase family protein [Nanoarchaeota archaeon]
MKILKVPYSLGALEKSKGLEKGPDSIIGQLKDIWLSEDFKKIDYIVEELKINSELKKGLDKIFDEAISKIDEKTLFLGGDHSITYSCFKAFSRKNKNSCLLIFDSHPDCYKSFETPSHGDWLRYLIKEKEINPKQAILVGIRNPDIKEVEFLRDNKIKFYTMKQLNELDDFCDMLMETCRQYESLYISIDIDVIDPAFAPGTGYIEPGGFTSRQFILLVQRLKLLKNLKAIDIVEVNPLNDVNNMTSKLAAKIIAEFM